MLKPRQKFALIITVLLHCLMTSHSHAVRMWNTQDTKAAKERNALLVEPRHAKKTKSSKSGKSSKSRSTSSTSSEDENFALSAPVAYAPVAWSPAMSPAEWSELYYGNTPGNVFEKDSSDTDEESENGKDSPAMDEQNEDDKDSLPADQQGKDSEDSPLSGEQSEDGKYPSLGAPQHIVVKVSVAVPRSVSPPGIQEQVAKVMTNVIRSYTPYLVYMLDVSRARRELQPTRLEYDPKFSSSSLAAHGFEETWWTFNVNYKVTAEAGDVEEANEIEAVAKSAVEDSILSGLFQQLLSQITQEVLGVALPGREFDRPASDDPMNPPNEGNTAQPSQNTNEQRNRGVGIGLAVLCFGIVFCIMGIFVVAHRRRKRRAEQTLAIPLGEQKDKGRIINAEWEASIQSVYSGGLSGVSETKGAFTLSPQDPPGSSYMLDSWDQGTYDGSADITDEITAWSFDSESFKSFQGSLT